MRALVLLYFMRSSVKFCPTVIDKSDSVSEICVILSFINELS